MLMQIKSATGGKNTYIHKTLPSIGSKFTGANSFIDTQNGNSWFVLPAMTDSELLIQAALLRKVSHAS